jgi:putative heme-binding domain-containing protein
MGMTWAHDSLYANVSGKGLFSLKDKNNDGLPETIEALGGATGGGEHGNHAVILSDDGKNLFVVAGNHTRLPKDLVKDSTVGWEEDLILPRMDDARGHGRGVMAPGGWISRVTPDGKNYRVHSMGYRNQYDVDLNRFGDLFAYDADMEWDMGSPWYRPTRICLALSGSDFGWRNGSGKWPAYYEDSLPSLIDIGPGSPTGVVSGTGAKFPAKYQDALFALDWTFGTIYAIHTTPSGAGYTATAEDFVSGAPLPVTDAIVGNDGHLYFTTGGRGTQSGLYRVIYTGNESTTAPTGEGPPEAAQARATRRSLEAFHGKEDATAITAAWQHLKSPDRYLRHAARLAIEAQPIAQWAEAAFSEQDPQARVTAAVALARSNEKSLRPRQIASLLELDPGTLSEGQFLGLLRAYQLTFMRLGNPDQAEKAKIIAQLDPRLPAESDNLNTELVRTLVDLDAPGIVAKTMDLIRNRTKPVAPDWGELVSRNSQYGGGIAKMLENPTPAVAINYAFMLRGTRYGWTLPDRRDYFTFLNEAGKYNGGASYPGYLTNTRDEALTNASAAERAALAALTGEDLKPGLDFTVTPPKGLGKAWTMESANASIEAATALKGRDFQAGRNLFHATACASCHQFGGEGGAIGPDLSTVRNKFSTHDLLEAIIEPSKVISDQYGSSTVTFHNGKIATGLVVEKGDLVEIYSHDPTAPPVSANHSDIASIEPFPVSQMPPGLLTPLSENELRDLIAFLLSRGNPQDPMFAK